MDKFAKLFDSPKWGQILVILHTGDDDKPELVCYVQPEGLGVCNISIGFDDWDAARKALEEADDKFVDYIAETLSEPFSKANDDEDEE